MKILSRVLFSILALVLLTGWSQKEIDHQINETNLIIGNWCSGTVIDKKKKLIVTANHCLGRITYFETLNKELDKDRVVRVIRKMYHKVPVSSMKYTDEGDLYSETNFYAEVLGVNIQSDLAILRVVYPSGISFSEEASLSGKKVRRGDRVYSVGNPFMFDGSLSEGIVSRPKLLLDLPGGTLEIISFTAHIYPGSSGGALYNDSGELIGITNWGQMGGPYFASPASNIRNLLIFLRL